jgi:hypothetical protein
MLFRPALLLALCTAGLASAQDAPAPAPVRAFGEPVSAEQLATYRGGFDLVKNDMQLNATVASNSAVNVYSGNNAIADSAFSNASGLPMVIQNSGSNVSIQNATVVNVRLQ